MVQSIRIVLILVLFVISFQVVTLSISVATQENVEVLKDIKDFEEFKKDFENCPDRASRAATACVEDQNEGLQTGIKVISSMVDALNMSGISGSCSKFGDAVGMANKLLTAYRGECSAFKGHCDAACGGAKKWITKIHLKLDCNALAVTAGKANRTSLYKKEYLDLFMEKDNGIVDASSSSSPPPEKKQKAEFIKNCDDQKKLLTKLKEDDSDGSVVYNVKKCQGYQMMIAQAGIGIGSMFRDSMMAKQCEKQMQALTPTGLTNLQTANAINCTDPKNVNMKECICKANPRDPICGSSAFGSIQPGGGMITNNDPYGTNSSANDPAKNNVGALDKLGDFDDELNNVNPANPTAGSGVGPQGNGGGRGLGSGGGAGQGGPNQQGGKAAGSRYNSDIFGSFGSGGGGGYGGGTGGSSSYNSDNDPKKKGKFDYAKFLPKPGDRNLAGAGDKGEITSGGGKSNFEKVRERYFENRARLLNE